MRVQIIAIFDSKAKVFSNPMFFPSVPVAVRSFTDAVREPDSQYRKHPEDYSLWHLGEFDDVDGIFHSRVPEVVVQAVSLTE